MILVLGGGLAGISAALEIKLTAPEKEVILLEARNRLGGATWSFEKDGVFFDNGQHVFLRCCTAYLEFLERIGSADSVYLQPRLKVPVLDAQSGKYATITNSLRMLGYGHLKLGERIKAARTLREFKKLDPADPVLDDISFGDWLAQRGIERGIGRGIERAAGMGIEGGVGEIEENGPKRGETRSGEQETESGAGQKGQKKRRGRRANAVDALWDLVVLPTVNLPVESASLKLAAKVFKTGFLEGKRNADIGWGLKPFSALHHEASLKTLKDLGVKVLLNTKVQGVELRGGGGGYGASGVSGDGIATVKTAAENFEAESLIIALPHNQLNEALGGDVVRQLLGDSINPDELGLSPIINVHFVFDRKIMDHQLLAGIGTEIQFVFDRSQAAGLGSTSGSVSGSAPNPKGAQCLAISLSAADKYLPQNAKEIEKHFLGEMLKIFPEAAEANLLHSMVTRENAATFRGTPGSHKHRAKTETQIRGVCMAGAWTDTEWPATMEGAVRSGKAAARVLTRTTG